MGTGRYMCLSCGRFFSMEYPLESWKTVCPFCGDIFFCDNIIPDVPPYVEDPSILDFTCGHTISTDFVGDVKFCPICSCNLESISGLKLKDWQGVKIQELGL